MNSLARLLITSLAVYITARLLPGVILQGALTAVLVAIILALINTFIRPILWLLTLPINILTLGLFTFILNAIIILIVSGLTPGFKVQNFWWALLFSLILSFINWLLNSILRERDPYRVNT